MTAGNEDWVAQMQRIMIIGGGGAGKSTLARTLARLTGLPVHHLDQVFWMADWVQRPEGEKLEMVRALEAQERWIIEGGILATAAERVARANVVVWLDLPVWLRLCRVLLRTVRFAGRSRPDMPLGCVQAFDINTLSFLRFIWKDRHDGRVRAAACLTHARAGQPVYCLRSRRAVRELLRGVALP